MIIIATIEKHACVRAVKSDEKAKTLNISFSFQCKKCNSEVPLALHSLRINELLALRGQLEDEIHSRKKQSLPASEQKAAKFNADQVFLVDLFSWWEPHLGPLTTEQIPLAVYGHYFTGKKPSSQFGVWMYHKSKERFSEPGLYVRHVAWAGDARVYEVRWLSERPLKSNATATAETGQ